MDVRRNYFMINLHESMWPDRGLNQRTLDSQSGSLPTALGGVDYAKHTSNTELNDLRKHICLRKFVSDFSKTFCTGMQDENLRSMSYHCRNGMIAQISYHSN